MNDKSLRRRPYIRERITGHECQLRIRRRTEDLHVAWINDLDCVYYVSKCAIGSRHHYLVVLPQFAQRAKERVAMSGNTCISRGPWKSCTANVSGGRSKDLRSCTFENHHRKMKAGYLDSSHRLSGAGRNNDEGTRKRLGVGHFRVALHLVIEEPARRTLRTSHIPFEVPKTGNGECAPDCESAPEIEQPFRLHRKPPAKPAWLRIESRRSRRTRAPHQELEGSQSFLPSAEARPA